MRDVYAVRLVVVVIRCGSVGGIFDDDTGWIDDEPRIVDSLPIDVAHAGVLGEEIERPAVVCYLVCAVVALDTAEQGGVDTPCRGSTTDEGRPGGGAIV